MRHHTLRTTGAAIAAVACLALSPATYAATGPDVFAVVNAHGPGDKSAGSVSLVGVDDYRDHGTVTVPGSPSAVAWHPDGTHLYVLSPGPRTASGRAKRPGTLSVVSVPDGKIAASLQVGWSPYTLRVPDAGDVLYVLAEGTKDRSGELTVVELEGHTVAKRVPLPGGASDALLFESASLMLVLGEPADVGVPKDPVTLSVVDLESLEVEETRTMVTGPCGLFAADDAATAFVQCAHRLGKKKDRGEGMLYVVDVKSREIVREFDIGMHPGRMHVERGTAEVYVLGHHESPRADSLLRVTKTGIVEEVTIGDDPWWVADLPGGEEHLVACTGSMLRVDVAHGEVLARVDLPFPARAACVSRSGDRAYVASAAGTEVAALDLEHGKLLAVQKTGRPGVKAGRVLGGLLSAAAGVVWIPGTASAGVDLNAEESFLYAINPKTDDVTILDTRSDQVVDRIATGKGTIGVQGAPSGPLVFVLAREQLTVMDSRDNHVLRVLPNAASRWFLPAVVEFREDRGEVLALLGNRLEVLDLATGETVGAVRGLPAPVAVLFHPSTEPAAGDGEGR
jgi:DNA-binding beta-propeller fold protein YncE